MADMTLEQVRDWHRQIQVDQFSSEAVSASNKDAADAIDAAIKQRERDKGDAARYRWLRDKSRQMSHDPDMSGNHYWLFGCNISYALRGPTADAAIDAAMAKESGNG